MKFLVDRPFADPDAAARKLLEIANSVEAVQDGRIHIEDQLAVLNGPCDQGRTPSEYKAGLEFAAAKGWLWMHESGTYVRFTELARRCLRDLAVTLRLYAAPIR
ncbi:hypothetical protein [Bradyrhizobium sp. ARR65]|uniref:hypothetical protein n=1 Tax=Bradyrhizobium sp. ARR65 TaxID=1040989 RepID=UPI0004643D9D|nr:hypothetical protein [Bradyrhizobium sp. ARR65]